MRLNELRDNPGARRDVKRLGRGIGSGKGKTAGHGVKGQKARSGVAINGFEGGQMPVYRRLPKRGFNNPTRRDFAIVNTGRIQRAIDAGKLDVDKPVTIEVLRAAGLAGKSRDGVRLLAKGELKAKLSIEITAASQAAVGAVEAAGGSITLTGAEAEAARRAGKKARSERRSGKSGDGEAKADGAGAEG
jgi:large subunit ribosomal protein L15